MFSEAAITEFFIQYAYSPSTVYVGIVVLMTASSFGMPLPEEIILVSSGFIAHMAHHPEEYPPPEAGAQGINLYTLATVCFVAVLASDVLIYLLGRFFGPKIFSSKLFKRMVSTKHLERVNNWYGKYGAWVCGLFRFTPGLRFPGHMSCGMMGVPLWKFLAVDGTAALLSVPTQVVLVAIYGKVILAQIKELKLIVGAILLVVLIFVLLNKFYFKKKNPS